MDGRLHHLEQAIADSGFRKAWIAERLGIRPWTLSRWLSGEIALTEANKDKLALLLRRSKEDLFSQPPADGVIPPQETAA